MTTDNLTTYETYEISPCRRVDFAGHPDPDGLSYEVCKPRDADTWILFGHIRGQEIESIGVFPTRQVAERTFSRITGIPFGTARKVATHLRVMRAGPKLLAALKAASDWIDAQIGVPRTEIQEVTKQALAEATGKAA